MVPGAVLAGVWRLRGMTLAAVAPLLSVTMAAVAAVILGALGIPWGGVQFFGCVTIVVVGLAVLRRFVRPAPETALPRPGARWAVPAGIAAGAALVVGTLSAAWGRPDAFSQTIDNVFHLNALTWIADTRSASSLTLGNVNGSGFYPAAWHAVVSLVMALTGQEPAVAIFAVSVAIAAAVWVPGCVYLSRQVLGRRSLVAVVSGTAAGSFAAFPLLLLDFGVLYPNYMAVAMLPAALGLAAQFWSVSAAPTVPRPSAGLLLLGSIPGLALTHPSSLHALVAFVWPMAAVFWWRSWKAAPRERRWRGVALLLGALAATGLLWRIFRPDPSSYWNPVEMRAQAIGEALMVAPLGQASTPIIAVFVLAGLASLSLAHRRRWFLGVFFVAAYLFVNVAAIDALPFRRTVAGPWYSDPYRLAALLPVAAVPVVTTAAIALSELVARVRSGPLRATGLRAATVAVLGAFLVGQVPNVVHQVQSAQVKYALTDGSELLTSDEKELLDDLPDLVPADAVLVGNPWTGTSLAYTFGDRRTLQLHLLSSTGPDVEMVNRHLDDAHWDPDVCAAVNRLGVRYILDFGTKEIAGGEHPYQGLVGVDQQGIAEVVKTVGEARLLRITACGA